MYEQTFLYSSTDNSSIDNFTFTLRIYTLWFKIGNVILCVQECFLIADTFTAIIWIASFTLIVLKTGALNIQFGVTSKFHKLGRDLLF